mgnify:CR=1 FL=1
MRRRIFKTFAATLLITSLAASAVFADDDLNSLKSQKSTAETELESLEDELAYVLVQIDNLETQMANLQEEIDSANVSLAEAEEKQAQQYEDMKLRIKYMYEDQTASITDVFLSSADMSEVLNKTMYLQSVYSYDRDKLAEMAETAKEIADYKATIESDKASLDEAQNTLTEKQASLYTTIETKKSSIENLDDLIATATEKAAATAAAKQAAEAAKSSTTTSTTSSSSSTSTSTTTTTASNNSATATKIVNLAYSLIGYSYVSGGASPSVGFDCSGLIYYIFSQVGISVSRTSSGQAAGGTKISSISEAQPGDIICYPGHVGIYIGNNMMIHAPVPGKTVCTINVYNLGMSITSIRRYW